MRFKEFLTEEKLGTKIGLEFQMTATLTDEEMEQSFSSAVSGTIDVHAHDSTKRKSPKNWHIQSDATIGENGFEITSPQLPVTDAIRSISKVCDWIQREDVKTTNECSVKIRINIPGIEEKLDPVKLVLLMGDHADSALKRFAGKFDQSQLDLITQKMKQTGKLPSNMKDMEHVAARYLMGRDSTGTFTSDYVELRIGGGVGYEKNADELKKKTAKMVANIEIACNPTTEKSEYLRDLTNLLTVGDDEIKVTGNDMHEMPSDLHRLYKLTAHMNDAWKIFEKDQAHGDARLALMILINTGLKAVKTHKTSLTLEEKTFFKRLAKQVALQSADVDKYYSHDHLTRLKFKTDIGI